MIKWYSIIVYLRRLRLRLRLRPEVFFGPPVDPWPGSHWVCMYFDNRDRGEYFDSYGRQPNNTIVRYMKRFASHIKFNKKCIQQPLTSTCGQLCVYYLIWRSRQIPLKEIVSSLDKSYADEFVTGFVNNLFKTDTVVFDREFLIDQICKDLQ